MRYIVFVLVVLSLAAVQACAAGVQVNSVAARDSKAWLDYTVPLPKQISITAEAVVPKGGVGLLLQRADDYPVYAQIRKEFADLCGAQAAEVSFQILIQVGGPLAEPLKKLENSDQAYRITPSQDNKTLVISCTTHRGAYYGWKTVQQLVAGRSTSDSLRIPILTVTDWPDMEKRGIWGTDNYNYIEWLADRKMNHLEQITDRGTDSEGKFYARTRSRENEQRLLTDLPSFAMDYAPVLLHLEQSWQEETTGKFHPEVKAVKGTLGTLCYSQPKTTEMIAEWIYQLAKESPTTEVDVWTSENMFFKTGCQCEPCSKESHVVNEARVILDAWEIAKKRLGKYITMYILTSEATEDDNPKIFDMLPDDVRIWYYHSLYTYNSIRQPMLRPYLADYVKRGKWMGVCPNLDAWTHYNLPFTGADFIHYRMDEFVTKGLQGLLGYATPRISFNYFNVEAAAEWTWNLKGRTPRDFAYSYAVRKGYKDPALFVKWSETIGPVGWDVYGSAWPAGQKKQHGVKAHSALKNGTLPDLGFIHNASWPTPWGNIKSEKQLNERVDAARRAVRMANQLGIPQYIHESYIIDGYIRNLNALYQMKKLAPKGIAFAPADQYKASRQLREFVSSADQVLEHLPQWEKCVAVEADRNLNFTKSPADILSMVVENVKKSGLEMGARLD